MDNYEYPNANPEHRVAGFFLDIGLFIVTLGIGWIIWSLIVWQYGQTPAKQVLKMKVYDQTTSEVARWGHMAIRQFLVPIAISIVISILGSFFNALLGFHDGGFLNWHSSGNNMMNSEEWDDWNDFGTNNWNFGSGFTSLFSTAWFLVDALWIFKGHAKHRIIDIICKTDVLNVSKGATF